MYEVGALFWYRVIFTAELIAAESLVVYRLKKRRYFALRLAGALVLCFGCAFAIPIVNENAAWISFMYMFLFAVSFVCLKFCFDESWIKLLFCAVFAYTLQHIAYQMYDMVIVLMGGYGGENPYGSGSFGLTLFGNSGLSYVTGNPFTLILYFYFYGMTYFFGGLLIKKVLDDGSNLEIGNLRMFVFAGVIMFFDIIVSAIITQYIRGDFNKFYIVFLDMYNIFCCIFALFLMFGVVRQKKLQNELFIIERLWNEKRQQYDINKENIDMINRKCHDLKHQIHHLGGNATLEDGIVKEIEDIIATYDSPVKTGNEALDIILTEKSILCNRSDVKLCCIVDGKSLSFMSNSDLYALFGNIIDNASEAVAGLEKDKRTISLTVREAKSFLVINIHNYYDGELHLEGQLPITTKGDTSSHGFGMKSVLAICKKYGGEMSITAENNVFNLNIAFPSSRLRVQTYGKRNKT